METEVEGLGKMRNKFVAGSLSSDHSGDAPR